MFCGKTEELIRRVRRALIAKQRVRVFKPSIDQRYDATDVVSHNGLVVTAQPVETALEILDLVEGIDVVGIDETQFFDNTVVDVVWELRKRGKRVILTGLDMDFKGEPFGPIPHLLAIAEYPTKLSAVCTVCGAPAHFSQRLVFNEDQVLVGEKEAYEARCWDHWNKE